MAVRVGNNLIHVNLVVVGYDGIVQVDNIVDFIPARYLLTVPNGRDFTVIVRLIIIVGDIVDKSRTVVAGKPVVVE